MNRIWCFQPIKKTPSGEYINIKRLIFEAILPTVTNEDHWINERSLQPIYK
jgi:hypothetical protein